MLRLPDGRDCLENRATDASCNIYLGLAMSLGAGLDGIEHGLEPGEPCTEDLYKVTPSSLGIETLPANLGQAIDAFDSDPLAATVLGPELKDAYATLKRDEWAAAQHHVMVASYPITCAHAISRLSAITGLTFPGMMLEPG